MTGNIGRELESTFIPNPFARSLHEARPPEDRNKNLQKDAKKKLKKWNENCTASQLRPILASQDKP